MKAVAVITEFNPFHNGHRCLLEEIKKAFPGYAVISVMSGSTVQRGEFAIQHKYARARSALSSGYDLVFELPYPFSVSAAEQFSAAGVYIARRLKAEILAFGSESGDLDALKKAAKRLSSTDFEAELKCELEKAPGESFITVKERTYNRLYGENLFSGGNDILALEYLKNTEMYGDITPFAVHRTAPFSATAARKAIYGGDKEEAGRILPQNCDCGEVHEGLKGLSALVLGHLRLTPSGDNGNGIRNAIKQAAERAESFEAFIESLPTKTYTAARLRREVISMLFNTSEEEKNALPQYTVLLGATETGLRYLSERKKEILLPVLTKKADAKVLDGEGKDQLLKAETVDGIYSLGFKNSAVSYFMPPVIIK